MTKVGLPTRCPLSLPCFMHVLIVWAVIFKVMKKVIEAWAKEIGYGMTYKCIKCKKSYEGKPPVCLHCIDPKEYR